MIFNTSLYKTSTGIGLPDGGEERQALLKASSESQDVMWDDLTAKDVGALPITGGTLTGDLRIDSTSTRNVVRIGSTDAVALSEPQDDCLEVQAKKVQFTLSDTSDSNFTVNGSRLVGRATFSEEIFNDYRERGTDSDGHTIGNVANWSYAHAEGEGTTASKSRAHAEGAHTIASGYQSHAEGTMSEASGGNSHAEGSLCVASGSYSHAGGNNCTASGFASFSHGVECYSNSSTSVTFGHYLTADQMQFVIGEFNSPTESYTKGAFIIGGGGTEDTRKNVFRVSAYGDTYGVGAFNTSGADYAELFEWKDGNPNHEDRAGLFVTLDGENIRLATKFDDYILGIVSATPSVVGDVYDDQWNGMDMKDVFGRPIMEMKNFSARYEDVLHDTWKKNVEVLPAYQKLFPKINPEYNNNEKYIPRTKRPEWDAVGLLGKLVAVDDGSCVPDGWAKVGKNGKATKSDERTKYRVMKRIDDSHIKIMIL